MSFSIVRLVDIHSGIIRSCSDQLKTSYYLLNHLSQTAHCIFEILSLLQGSATVSEDTNRVTKGSEEQESVCCWRDGDPHQGSESWTGTRTLVNSLQLLLQHKIH